MLTEILEHVPWRKVGFVISEALRVTKRKILITLPIGPGSKCSQCFKHAWRLTEFKINQILRWLPNAKVDSNDNFVYMEVAK